MTLEEFAKKNPKSVLAFSGGTDSAFLLYMGKHLGVEWTPVYVRSAFQPEFELADAKKLASELGVPLTVLDIDVLADQSICKNPANRCYYCKKMIMETLLQWSRENGFDAVLDGTNASDETKDRPGMRVLSELGILSPLRLAGISKADVRRLSRAAGLFTWNKPSYACLATRIPTGEPITEIKLRSIENSEAALQKLGFRDFRLRTAGDRAILQVTEGQFGLVLERRREISDAVRPFYADILLDLNARKSEVYPGGVVNVEQGIDGASESV